MFPFHIFILLKVDRLEQSIKSIFILTYREELFSLTQNIAKCIFTYLKGASFQKAQAEFTSTYPKSASPLPQPSSCSIPLLSATPLVALNCLKIWNSTRLTAVLFQSKTTTYSKKLSEIVQIDICHEGKLCNVRNCLKTSREASSLPNTDTQHISMEGSGIRVKIHFQRLFYPIKKISEEKNIDWQILPRLKTCCSSSLIFRPGNPFPLTDLARWN